MASGPRTLLARASAASKAMTELNRHVALSLGFAVLLFVVYQQADGRGLMLVALLLGAPLGYLIYRAIRALGKELRLYDDGLAYVSRQRGCHTAGSSWKQGSTTHFSGKARATS